MSAIDPAAAKAELRADQLGGRLAGAWTLAGIQGLEQMLEAVRLPTGNVRLDGAGMEALDTAGALFLLRTVGRLRRQQREVRLVNLRPDHQALIDLVLQRGLLDEPERPKPLGALAGIGKSALNQVAETQSLLSFVGAASIALIRSIGSPRRVRGQALGATLQSAGVDALPIIGLMSFLLGVVIAYQGGLQLKAYGANIFIVELVSLTMLRELAPLITAIMVAGRTGSAFTAQIGTMRVTEEVDALRTIGIDPLDMLVLPKLLALIIALPLLTVFADALSIFGGMVMAQAMLGVSFADFVNRIPQTVSVTSFLVGVGKAPVFAAIIALVGCFQGFRVGSSAESVGRQTTVSVVQSIFLVICADAAFSVVLGWLGI